MTLNRLSFLGPIIFILLLIWLGISFVQRVGGSTAERTPDASLVAGLTATPIPLPSTTPTSPPATPTPTPSATARPPATPTTTFTPSPSPAAAPLPTATPTLSPTATPTATPTSDLGGTATAAVQATVTQQALVQIAQAQQTSQATTATANVAATVTAEFLQNTAPVLISPEPNANTYHSRARLTWEWVGTLGPDEYFQVEIRNRYNAFDPVITAAVTPIDVAWVKEYYYERDYVEEAYDREFTWRIVVVRGTPPREKDWSTVENRVWEPGPESTTALISRYSEMRTLYVETGDEPPPPPPGSQDGGYITPP